VVYPARPVQLDMGGLFTAFERVARGYRDVVPEEAERILKMCRDSRDSDYVRDCTVFPMAAAVCDRVECSATETTPDKPILRVVVSR
jgi:hypothetical protein